MSYAASAIGLLAPIQLVLVAILGDMIVKNTYPPQILHKRNECDYSQICLLEIRSLMSQCETI